MIVGLGVGVFSDVACCGFISLDVLLMVAVCGFLRFGVCLPMVFVFLWLVVVYLCLYLCLMFGKVCVVLIGFGVWLFRLV